MRILLLSREVPPDPGIGGIGSYTATIAPALAARGHDVHVLSCRPEQDRSDDSVDGVWIHRRGVRSFRGLGRLIARSPDAVRRVQAGATNWLEGSKLGDFDVVESPEWMAEGLLFGMRRRAPLVAHLHTPVHILAGYAGVPRGNDLRWSDWLERRLVSSATVATSPSRLLDRVLRDERWMRRPAKIIPYPMDVNGWTAGNGHPTSPVVLFVGRLEYRKAPELLVQSVADLRHEVPDVKAVFIGKSSGERKGIPYGDWTMARAQALDAPAEFVGWAPRQDLVNWYAKARVVAVPSRFESYSMTALEGMAMSRPVVYTSRVGAGEVLAGSAGGTEVRPDDPAALTKALRPYLTDASHAETAGRAAAEAVRRTCAPTTVAALREACYEDAVMTFRRRGSTSKQ